MYEWALEACCFESSFLVDNQTTILAITGVWFYRRGTEHYLLFHHTWWTNHKIEGITLDPNEWYKIDLWHKELLATNKTHLVMTMAKKSVWGDYYVSEKLMSVEVLPPQMTFHDVSLYRSNPWEPSIEDKVTLRNFQIETELG